MHTHSTIAPHTLSKTGKRLGRGHGSGLGGSSGRGFKGQNSRTGHKRYPTFEGGQTSVFMRTPKRRGFTAYKPELFVTVNLDVLEKIAQSGTTTIDYAVLYERRIIRKKGYFLKVLGGGEIKTAIQITADAVSANAKIAIEKAGGAVHLEDVALATKEKEEKEPVIDTKEKEEKKAKKASTTSTKK